MRKQEVKDWLKAIGKDRFWLAEKTGVQKCSVDTWLSTSRPISRTAARLISALMVQYQTKTVTMDAQAAVLESDSRESTLSLTVPAEVFDTWNEAAMRDGKLLREWAVDALIEAAEEPGEG